MIYKTFSSPLMGNRSKDSTACVYNNCCSFKHSEVKGNVYLVISCPIKLSN